MDATDRTFDLLMSEKEHADKQIDTYMDLQIKLLGIVLAALAAAAGWIFGQKNPPEPQGAELSAVYLVGSTILSMTLLQTNISYGIALGYMHYKNTTLAAQFATLTAERTVRLVAVAAWSASPARKPVVFSAAFIAAATLLIALGLDIAAWKNGQTVIVLSCISGGILWLGAVTSTLLTGIAMKNTGVASAVESREKSE